MKINEPVLVIAERLVEELYPGGIEGFVATQARAHGQSQRLTRTDQLVALSDTDENSLIATYERLCRVFRRAPGEEPPCVFVDPVAGIMEPCDWLTCTPEADGSAIVEIAEWPYDPNGQEEPDFPAPAPADASPELAPRVPTLLKLAEEGGFITWLDLETGRQLTSASLPAALPAARPPSADADTADTAMPMLDAVTAMIASRGWDETTHDDEEGIVTLRLDAGPLLALKVVFLTSPNDESVLVAIRVPGRTPKDRIDAVTNFLAGANWGLDVGNFDINYADGAVVFRAAVITPDGLMRPSAAGIALDRSVGVVKHYAAGLIEVAAGADPREVLARIEGA